MGLEKKGTTLETMYRLPGWVLGWLYATAAICTWDASFIMLRPYSMPGGRLFPIWKPYTLYISIDQRYGDMSDPFVFGISLFNYAEVLLNIVTIIMHYKNSRHTIPMAFTVSVMTFWKTLFYFYAFSELGGGAPYRVGNTFWEEFFLVGIPNGVWIILPFLVMVALWTRMIPAQFSASASAVNGAEAADRFSLYPDVADNDHSSNNHNDNIQVKGSVRKYFEHAKHA